MCISEKRRKAGNEEKEKFLTKYTKEFFEISFFDVENAQGMWREDQEGSKQESVMQKGDLKFDPRS